MQHRVWTEERLDGLRLLRGRLAGLEVALLPEVGAKTISLRSPSGREWLWQTPRRPYRAPAYAGTFEAYDISGFDECFPGIAEGPYPTGPWQGVTVPDHGELWTLPWQATVEGDTLALAVYGVRFPYYFQKRVSLVAPGPDRPAAVLLAYRLENLSPFPMRYLWSAHPLLAVRPGARVLLPDGVRVRVDWSRDNRLGTIGAEHPWPNARTITGQDVALDVLPEQGAGGADKLYTDRLPADPAAGWCALYDPADDEHLAFRFDPRRVPYVGVWLNASGWPLTGDASFNVALEPCTAFPDRLDLAVQRDEAATLEGRATVTWTVQLEFDRGGPRARGLSDDGTGGGPLRHGTPDRGQR